MEAEDLDPVVRKVLAGQVRPEDLPSIPQRVVRVYLSSTGIGTYLFAFADLNLAEMFNYLIDDSAVKFVLPTGLY